MKIDITHNKKSDIDKVDFSDIKFGAFHSDHMFEAEFFEGSWKNFKILPFDNITISPACTTLHYGQTIFEGLKAYKNKEDEIFASTLDGLEHFGKNISLSEIKNLGKIDLMLTGASAVSKNGVRFGKGHGFFDLEWGMFADLKIVDEKTPIVAVVHDVQVVSFDLEPSDTDIIVDWIITNKQKLSTNRKKSRPSGIYWNLLEKGMLEATPPLRELKKILNKK